MVRYAPSWQNRKGMVGYAWASSGLAAREGSGMLRPVRASIGLAVAPCLGVVR
jgi:hypothetical protein